MAEDQYNGTLEKATALTRARYQRIAPIYDFLGTYSEKRYIPWRRRLWKLVEGEKILEIGVGTGKNIPFYPVKAQVTGIDLTPGMLEKAKRKAFDLNHKAILQLGDVQFLDFPDNTFDAVVATFVFCSVPDPIKGFREIKRVLKPGGMILLLEHMRANHAFLGMVMDILNPLVVRIVGANINRSTVQNALTAQLHLAQVEDLWMNGIFKLIIAGKNPKK